MSRKAVDLILRPVLRDLSRSTKEMKQHTLLQRLIHPDREPKFRSIRRLPQQFIKHNQNYLKREYRDRLNEGSIFIITRDLNKGFDRKKSLDIESTNIDASVFQKLIKIPLHQSRPHKLLSFPSTTDFLSKMHDVSTDEYNRVTSVLINTRKVPVENLEIDTDDQEELNYQSLLKQTKVHNNQVDKVLSSASSLGLLKVLIRGSYVVLTE